MKSKKKLIISSISFISLLSIYKLSEYMLRMNNLAFTNFVVNIFIFFSAILVLSIFVQTIVILYNIAKKGTLKLPLRVISGIGTIIISVSIIVFLLYGFVAFSFTHKPEHIVEKNGKQMVACVDSFLQVNVNYYDYVNPFVRENRVKMSEYYGKGGYDPFKLDEMPPVIRSTYYNESGNVIESISLPQQLKEH